MKTCIFIIILFSIRISYAQTAHGNAPIQIGNKWVFENDMGLNAIYEIIDSIAVIDSIDYHIYHSVHNDLDWPVRIREDGFYVEKRDTSYDEPFNEMIFYKKGALPEDSWEQKQPWVSGQTYTALVTDTFTIQIFDTLVVARDIYIDFGLNVYYELWTDEFGLIADADFWGPTSSLKGCIINGKVYGDTITTDIKKKQERNYIPEYFIIYPNFPNPFNHATTIHYRLFKSTYIELSVYNMSGQKIAHLVSEKQPAGDYKYKWNATHLSSGVYFIRMSMRNKTHLHKAVLIR